MGWQWKLVAFASLVLAAMVAHGAEARLVFYVSASGDDGNPGTEAAPFATLTRARDAIREGRKIAGPEPRSFEVIIRGGRYRVTDTLTLAAEDSGTEQAPVVWQAAPGEQVRLIGGVRLAGWKPVIDSAVLERLAPAARGEVWQVPLGQCGATDYGVVKPGLKRAELFFDNQYMTLARYPNEGWERIAAIPEGVATKRPVSDPKRPDLNRHDGPFVYSGDRPERWAESAEVWMHGYWFHDWSDQYHQVLRFDVAKNEVWPKPPYHAYGYKAGQRYYFLNILEELDQPGEWYLDRATGLLYFWPPRAIESAEVMFPDLEKPILLLDNTSHVHIRGITFECSRAGAIVVQGGSHNEIAGCVVRNVGGTAIGIAGGTSHTVRSCDVYEVATTGVAVDGGDRKTLARGDHVVENCHIHDFARVEKTYRPGISLQGVGNRVSHCLLHDCPHEGIGYGGNDHVIEFCEFTRIAEETGDVGVTYTAMDWTYMGHVFRYNHFHHIHAPGKLGCFTVYPDLPCGGIHLYGNVFYDVDLVFLTNSGRGMVIENNLFVRCRNGIRFNVWMDMSKFRLGGNWRMVERLQEVNYDRPPYSTRYPVLARLAEDFAKGDAEALQRALPKDNIIRRNVSWGNGYFLQLGPQANLDHVKVEQNLICDPVVFVGSPSGDGDGRTYENGDDEIRTILEKTGNIIASGDPGLVDPEGGDLRLREDSPAWKLGYEPIPLEEIGLYVDSYRKSLPPCPEEYAGNPYTGGDTYADTWVATDDLGRTQPGIEETGPVKSGKWVGIFYWTWHRPNPGGPNDNTKIIAAAGDGPVQWPENGAPHHWGEPELGYYLMTDPFVIRKHASMLSDAGIDVILFDTTNPPWTWKDEYEALCREYAAMRKEGNRTPAIGFITPFWDPTEVVNRLWQELYRPGLWLDLWFSWEGKPLLLANKDFIKDEEMLGFFTFRRPMPDYWLGPDGPDQWSWLEVHPQHVFRNSKGEAEQMSVGVAQNALPNTPGPAPMAHKAGAMGRSWHNGAKDEREGAVLLGLNFEEQWKRALEVDPKFIFVTGWNEWIAGRYTEWSKYTDADCYYPGGLFVDQYTQEYSRDCEPMRGGHTDSYYYQLASWVRWFKGVRPRPEARGPNAIAIDGVFEDWTSVTPEFRDTIGDVIHRDHPGYGSLVYRNDTGRNNFVFSKAAYDEGNLFFFAQTMTPITPYTDSNWMLLLLDTDQNGRTGWLGYDFVVNQEVSSDAKTTVKAWRDGAWETIGASRYRVNGNGMEIAVPRDLVEELEKTPAFDFHWADNIQRFGDVSELGVNGDSAPNRRWNYRYTVAQ